ncbi:MAG: thioredoxin family protein, partial [Planctomycetota bacterium]|nr:thioredoxin family protein [Planctomycetota bacterium]
MLRVSFSDSFAAICSLSAHCWSRTAGSVVHLSMVVLLVGGGLAPTVGESGEVLEFSGPGCLACQRMSPLVEKLKRQGYPIRVLDIRRAPRLARQLDIKLLPTFVLIESGR